MNEIPPIAATIHMSDRSGNQAGINATCMTLAAAMMAFRELPADDQTYDRAMDFAGTLMILFPSMGWIHLETMKVAGVALCRVDSKRDRNAPR